MMKWKGGENVQTNEVLKRLRVEKHMTQDDRKALEARYNAGQSVAGIARAMSFNYSTIYKELKRGDTGKMDANGRAGYSAELGQQRLYNAKQRLRYRADCQAE